MAQHKYLDYDGLVELVSKLKAYTDDKVEKIDLAIVVTELPTSDILTNKIYLVPSPNAEEGNVYDEYIYVNGAWELLGSVTLDTDLSNYYTKEEVRDLIDTAITGEEANLSNYYTKTETDSLLDAKQDVLTAGNNITINDNVISATVPTKVSELENDSEYVTENDLEIITIQEVDDLFV